MKIYPVIHYLDRATAVDQAAIIKKCGADGIFLISHKGNDSELLDAAWEIKQKYAHEDFPIGVNLLSSPAVHAAMQVGLMGLDMVWADYMGVSSDGLTEDGQTLSSLALDNPHVKFFASVAFKYQKRDSNPTGAAVAAQIAGFIATTSGPATGYAPTLEKIAVMSYGVNGNLAIASGMTPENIAQYAPYLKYVLVATGIAKDDYRVDEDKLRMFIINSRHGGETAVVSMKETYAAIADALDQAAENVDLFSVQTVTSQLHDMAGEWRARAKS